MYYFAYGSNMSLRRLKAPERVPSAKIICSARLPEHRLVFHKKSKDDSAKCDACYTGNPNDLVIGILFEINEAEKKKLNRAEGLGFGYKEKEVVLLTDRSKQKAIMYYATDFDPKLKPYGWYKELVLRVPEVFVTEKAHKVFRQDIFGLVEKVSADLAYFDPPYGSNNEKMPPSRVRYASYYHLWTTICLNDRPKLFGKAARREDTSDVLAASVFEEFRKDSDGRFIAVKAIERLIKSTRRRSRREKFPITVEKHLYNMIFYL